MEAGYAQDLAPRAYMITPTHSNAVTLTGSYQNGEIFLNGVEPVPDSYGQLYTSAFTYYHSFGLLGRSTNITASMPYAAGSFSGTAMDDTDETTGHRSGLPAPEVRFSINLLGGPAMDLPKFKQWHQKTLLGASLLVLPPLGQYDPTRLINLGANRWSFRPEVGYPSLYEGTTPVEVKKTPEEGYHLMDDMTTKAINWIGQQKALIPDKPFFVYFAPGATHAPHHVPTEWADKYKGKFDQGWDKLREETFARQLKLGVIPPDSKLTPRPPQIPAWDDMPAELKPVLIRQMEVYAGFMEYTDHHVGRLVDALEGLNILDDTLIYYIIGDNGASAEGTLNGTYNEMINFNGAAALETPEFLMERLDKLGGPESYNHYAVGWAHALNTPYQWTKQVASHFGGTRNGTIVHWPKGVEGKGELRTQFHHVIDVAPTILELAGLPQPTFVNGVQQRPIEGVSMAYSFNDAKAAEQHETQYFEMFGNRGIYHKGWTAVTRHKTPWLLQGEKTPAFDDDVWELYDTTKDWSQADNLAKQMPEKLHELQRLWLIEAVRFNVLPLDDNIGARMNSDLAGRPVLIKGKSQILFGSMGRLSENSVLNMKNKSHAVTAEIVVPQNGVEGVIVAQGGNIGGWSLYAKGGKLKYCYNLLGIQQFYAESADPLPPGQHQVRMEFTYAGGGMGKGGTATLYVDGKKVGEGKVAATAAVVFSADDGCDVGIDTGSPVSPEYGARGNEFTGTIKGVQLAIAEDAEAVDHLVDPEHAMQVAMARQ